jgi:serine/threonine protein kinase/tetratricopeptide (TPR) repeat protein/class 3 adenylate cyclase
MTPERWKRIDELLDALLELDSGKWHSFLDVACASDMSLRREVESLLAAHGQAEGFIDALPSAAASGLFPPSRTAEVVGNSVAHYRVLSSLGAGGMGEVYLARDTKLGRHVALKLLAADYTRDRTTISRFQQEACAASALNHPNILTVHEIGQQNDFHFIATEYIEGDTLRQQMAEGPMSTREALEIATQIASALEAAHAAGIVHRDIKPENVMRRPDGLVKILDFGIAKLTQSRALGAESETSTPNIQTETGMVVGTIHYMSPEQLRGLEVDSRSDIFSLGVVLYEMIAGLRPFGGDTPGDAVVSLLDREPRPLDQIIPRLPAALPQIVGRALAKNREARYQDCRELLADLKNLQQQLEAESEGEQVTCRLCKRGNPRNFAFCGTCGSSLKRSCPNCGKAGAAADVFCGLCGYRFLESPDTISFAVTAPAGNDFESMQPSQTAERRRATIIHAIVSGCEAILEQLGPQEGDVIIGSIKNAVSEIIASHGGIVDRCSGEELVALFGVPTSYEDDCLRAVHAMLKLRLKLREMSVEIETLLGRPLRVYAGISSGAVVARLQEDGRHKVSGNPPQVAARLAANANPDEILVSPETQRLIAPFFRLSARGSLSLDPKAQPLTVYRVDGETGIHTRLEAAELFGLTTYTGRAKELQTLHSSLDKALAGEGQFVTVVGDAGVGKSRLLLEFRRALMQQDQQPVVLLESRCQAHRSRILYSPFIDVLRDLLGLHDDDPPEALLEAAVRGIGAIDPILERYTPLYLHLLSIQSGEHELQRDLKGDELRLAVEEALSAIFTLNTRRGLTIVLLEDWHWADAASVDALKRLAGMASTCPLLIVVTCRPETALDWGYIETHALVNLGPLDRHSTILVLKSLLDAGELPPGLGDLVYRRTGGNPFFIEELCRTLTEEGRVRVIGGIATLVGSLEDLHLPDTVQAIIRTRLDRLDSESQKLLRHASVIGREFDLHILERMIEERPSQTAACLRTLQTHGLVQQIRVLPEPAYRFRHVLTQEVAYDSLLLHQRKALHEAAGQAIEQLYSGRIEEQLEVLTHHYSRAEDWDKAVQFGQDAAEKASRLSRFSEALTLLEQTEGWLDRQDGPDEKKQARAKILLQQERLCETLGMRGRQQELINRVLSLVESSGDQSLLADALVRQGELYTLLRRFDEAERALGRSLEIRRSLADPLGERVALRSAGFLHWQQGRYDDAVSCHRAALTIDERQNDSAGRAQDLTSLGTILRSQGNPAEALDYLHEALKINESLGRSFNHVFTLDVIANVYRDLLELDRAMECYKRASELASQHRWPLYQIIIANSMASLYWERGEIDDSIRVCGENVSLTRSLDMKRELGRALSTLSQRLLAIDRFGEALPHLEEAAAIFARLGDTIEHVRTLTSIAYVHERCASNPAQTLAAWETVRSLRSDQSDLPGQIEALEGMARVARGQARDPGSALAYLRHAVELSEHAGVAAKEGELLNTVGIVRWSQGDYSGALESYERALKLFLRIGDKVHAGLMLNSIGVTLGKLGRTDDAVMRLREAIQVHRESRRQLLEGHAFAALGDIFTEGGFNDQAIDHYRQSLDIRLRSNDRRGEGWMLQRLSSALFARGDSDRAANLLSQAIAIADELGDEQMRDSCVRLSTRTVR